MFELGTPRITSRIDTHSTAKFRSNINSSSSSDGGGGGDNDDDYIKIIITKLGHS